MKQETGENIATCQMVIGEELWVGVGVARKSDKIRNRTRVKHFALFPQFPSWNRRQLLQ